MGLEEGQARAAESHGLHPRLPNQPKNEGDTLSRLMKLVRRWSGKQGGSTYPLYVRFEARETVALDALRQTPPKVRDEPCLSLLKSFTAKTVQEQR